MIESPDTLQAGAEQEWDEPRSIPSGGWLSNGLRKVVDPLYVWSALAGLLVALVLIAIAMIVQGRFAQ